MKAINPQIMDDLENTPMTREELKRKEFLEKILKDNWFDEEQFDLEQGKRLYELRENNCWKYGEIFRIKTGKNKGKFDKKPKFDKYLKDFRDRCSLSAEVSEMKNQLKKYEGYLRQKKYHEEQVEKFKKMEDKLNGE